MSKKQLFLIGISTLLIPCGVKAQDTVPTPATGGLTPVSPTIRTSPEYGLEAERVITLQEAIELSFGQNPSMEAHKRAHEAAEFNKKSTWGLRLPHLATTAAYVRMGDDIGHFDFNNQKDILVNQLGQIQLPVQIPPQVLQSLQQMDLQLTIQKKRLAFWGVSATMPIYMGGKINAAVNAQKINIDKSHAEGEKTQVDLFAEVVERYYGLSLAQQVSKVRKEVTEGMRKHLFDARKMEENGMIARTETLYAEMHLAKAEGAETSADLQIETVNKALSTSLNEPGRYLPVTALFVVDDLKPLTYYQEQVKTNSPILKQVELTKRLAKEGVRAARSQFLPEVAAIGIVDVWNYNVSDAMPKWAVGAAAKLRIFDGLGTEYKHAAAKREVMQVEAIQVKAENDLMALTEQLYNLVRSSAAEAHALEASVEFAKAYLDSKQKAFAEGFAPSSDVVDAQLNLAAVKTERLAAAYAFDVALAQLLALAGETETFGDFVYQSDYHIISNE